MGNFPVEDYLLKKGDEIEIIGVAKDGSVWIVGPYFRSPCLTTMQDIETHCKAI